MKVGFKARRGRKRNPVPHRSHRTKGAIGDPISRAMKRMDLLRAREDRERYEHAAWHDGRRTT